MDSFLYQYSIGGVVFLIGMVYAWRQGYVGLGGGKLRNLLLMIGGLVFYMGLQGYLQYAPMETTPPVKYEGEPLEEGTLGTPLDYGVMIAYFLAIFGVGTWFGRRQKTTKDFFFGGQRFSWWLIAMSMVATLVGSYSFVKYSRVAFQYGLSSSQSYLNDWFWMPLFVFGWLPIFYFSRITSIPEYFERRFGRGVRICATFIVLTYLVSYVGVNLYTMGKALHILLGWEIFWAAVLVASISAIYVTFGGQTSVIMTDLFQGGMLLATGLLILVLGIDYMGGFDLFWQHLPRGHRLAFANFNKDSSFSGVGIFWQDAMANSAMFYFLNQGIVMRFMAARSVGEARKAALFVVLVMMPLAACVVASGGWVGKALVHAGLLPETVQAEEAFFVAARFLSTPGLFGLIMAAVTAALMSTVDTLITAVSAVVVNDIYKPYVSPQASEKQLLRVARVSAVGVTLFGICLVPVFMQFKTIYSAHGAMTAAITPPLVVTLLCSVFWRRFTRVAALCTLAGGVAAIALSIFVPQVIVPLAHGVPMGEAGDELLAGLKQYKFMRALYGLSVSSVIAVAVTFLTRPQTPGQQRGLVWGTVSDAIKHYKGSWGSETAGKRALAMPVFHSVAERLEGAGQLPLVRISQSLGEKLNAHPGDLLYVSDRRWWLGGLHSTHVLVGELIDQQNQLIELGPQSSAAVVVPSRSDQPLLVERLY